MNGSTPYGDLTLAGNKLYGMTFFGGAFDEGIIFSVDTNGAGFKDLTDFNGINGMDPYGSLTLVGHTLYGMTYNGGAVGNGNIFSIDTDGSGFKDLFDFSG